MIALGLAVIAASALGIAFWVGYFAGQERQRARARRRLERSVLFTAKDRRP